jgi:tRNA-dihydrouridine synthase B
VQGHTGEADWELIRDLKATVRKPVVGNGDIKAPQDAARMLSETGCDGVMIGRAAIGNPWILRDTDHYLRTGDLLPAPSFEERREAAVFHVCELAKTMGEDRAVRHLRGQLPQYFHGYRGVTRLRDASHAACSIAVVERAFSSLLDPQ